jgi:uncharacterized Rossmann fold enzyme
MHNGKYVLAQLLDFIDKDVFLRISNKYNGNRYVKDFTCWNQLAVMVFGQLSNRESLRDVVLATQAHASKAMVEDGVCPTIGCTDLSLPKLIEYEDEKEDLCKYPPV